MRTEQNAQNEESNAIPSVIIKSKREVSQPQQKGENLNLTPVISTPKVDDRQGSKQQLSESKEKNNSPINVALISDFYFPFVGGVQIHIKQLATQLIRHSKIGNVIVITHKYDHHNALKYTGVKNIHGFRVYYLNIPFNKQYMITYPTFIFNFRLAARILKKQKINIVHCHQTGSTLSLEYIFFAKILGIRVILTQHSLYGFRSFFDIHFNRFNQFFVGLCDKVIAVSKTTRNNIILRTKIDKNKVIVIPNGVSNVSHIKKKRRQRLQQQKVIFKQNFPSQHKHSIKIISVGRMTYRRGTDLLIQILPKICEIHQKIQVLIVGDGVKRKALQKIIQNHNLYPKVRMLGVISDHDVLLEKMSQCDIFLNTPLTQSFGIALAQAAMIGLCCVSTDVGGVSQAVPPQHLFLSQVNPQKLVSVLTEAIIHTQKLKRNFFNLEAVNLTEYTNFEYRWQDVSQKTVQLYQHLISSQKTSRRQCIKNLIFKWNFLQMFFVLLGIVLGLCTLLPFFI